MEFEKVKNNDDFGSSLNENNNNNLNKEQKVDAFIQ